MLLIYTNETAESHMTPEEVQAAIHAHQAVMDETSKRGIFRGAEPLHRTNTATTVRVQDGRVLTTDGPFAETKEQLGGYYILDCENLDEAIAWAARIPTSCGGAPGCVEIRPIHPLRLRETVDQADARSEAIPIAR
jgi:hypothetical protein